MGYDVFEEVLYAQGEQEWSITKGDRVEHFKNLTLSIAFGDLGEVGEQARHAVTVHGETTETEHLVIIHEYQNDDFDQFRDEIVNLKDFFHIRRAFFLPGDEGLLKELRKTDGLCYYRTKGVSERGMPIHRRDTEAWPHFVSWNHVVALKPFHPHLETNLNLTLTAARKAFRDKRAMILAHCRHSQMISGKRWTDAKKIPLVLSIGFGIAQALLNRGQLKMDWRTHEPKWKEPYPSRWRGGGLRY